MKKLLFILLLTILFLLNSCNKANNDLEKLSDSEFITLIANNKNPIKGLLKIDSLIDNNTFYKHKLALIYYHKASYLIVLRKHAKSIAYANKSLSLFKEEANELYIGRANNLLAIDNINLNNEREALKQINIALDIFKKLDNKREEVVALDVLARLYYINKDYDKALDILKRSLKIYSTLDAKENESATYGNIGSIYKEANDYKNAIYYYTQGININKKYNILNSNSLQDLGLLYLKNNNPEKCIDLHIQSLEIQNKTGHLYIQKQIYDVLLDSIKGKTLKPSVVIGRYFNNLPNYMLKRDSIIKLIDKIKVEDRITSIESQYKLQTKKSELNQEIELNKKNKWLFTIILVLLFFLGLFLIQRNRNKQLKLLQDKLVLEQKVLRSQMNPHFIFNALTSIQKNLLEEDLLKSSTSLSKFAKLIRQNFEFTSKEFVSLDEDLNALKNYIETQQLRFEDKFDYKINIAKNIDLSYIKIPPMLLQPFVENAIEHGLKIKKEKGNLIINVLDKNEGLHFEIIDDGIGYKKSTTIKDREHATDIFLNRLKLRKLGEEKSFTIEPSLKNGKGTKVSFSLKI